MPAWDAGFAKRAAIGLGTHATVAELSDTGSIARSSERASESLARRALVFFMCLLNYFKRAICPFCRHRH